MNIDIVFATPHRRWHSRLADVLRDAGHAVRFVAKPGARPRVGAALALAVERRLFGPPISLFDALPTPAAVAGPAGDLVIALDGGPTAASATLEPLFAGAPGEAALLAMLVRRVPPDVRVCLTEAGRSTDLVSAAPAVEEPTVLSRALDQMIARLVTLIAQAVHRFGTAHQSPPGAPPTTSTAPPAPVVAFVARNLVRKVAGRLPGRRRDPVHWRIAFRQMAGPGAATDRAWATAPFKVLPDDGRRFLADPVPFEHDGQTHLFFEDFPYATGKGVIGHAVIGADGTISPTRTVLEQPCHLSYPVVLAHAGAIYMMPEMSASKRLQLFRAGPFPDCWVADRVLIEGRVLADATPCRHGGLWWLFATASDDGGSSWDQLELFHAPDLFGPWTPHRDNPVLVDASAARPAGALWTEEGVLMRVAQDCRDGYGAGLAICRVDRLDPEGYAQTVVARLAAPPGHGADGVHTLNRAGALEVIDLRTVNRPAAPRGSGRG